MKNLQGSNVLVDYGSTDVTFLKNIENDNKIIFPIAYCDFITKYNGASLIIDSFDFYDAVHNRRGSECIAFMKVEKIKKTIESLLHQSTDNPDDPDIFKFYKYFDERLIPFGDTGGGDLVCFDYIKCNKNPSIVLWCHDYCDDHWNRISFVANNFEEFVNMLHKPDY